MNNIRICQISDDLFWGYRCAVDLNKVTSNESLCNFVKINLKKDLLEKNLIYLDEMLDGKNGYKNRHYHVHGYTFQQLLEMDPKETIYVCCH
jgi:hypothetical protein